MIYVKTNLRKIPETCNKCKFSKQNRYFGNRYCYFLDKTCEMVKNESGNWEYIRLKDCPLFNID